MFSIIIPVYKNKEPFLDNLRHNYPYIKDNEIIIVNDDPEESLKKDLVAYPDIILLENEKNLGFGQSINKGIKRSSQQYLFLLNSDVVLENKDYQSVLSHYKNNSQLFAVSLGQKEKDGSIVGKNEIYWKNGLFLHKKARNITSGNNAWAEGGSCIIDKQKLIQLDYFDPLYSPFYWEDLDLSYRAWKYGFTILFDSSIIVTHHHESTIRKYFTDSQIKTIAFRNQLIFIWKNITDHKLLINHLLSLPYVVLSHCYHGQWYAIKGLLNACIKLPIIFARRNEQRFEKTDKQILLKFL